MKLTIRKEKPADAKAIHDVTVAAFLDDPHTEHTEQFIVRALREAGALSVSLVAETQETPKKQGEIIGHVAVSPVTVSDGSRHWYGLGPISVLPQRQGQGVGTQLMQQALAELKTLGASGCVLLGDPGFYGRFGFKPVAGLVLPDLPPEYFLAVSFCGTNAQGTVTYHDAFSAKR